VVRPDIGRGRKVSGPLAGWPEEDDRGERQRGDQGARDDDGSVRCL
jgi:hypothetical protein